MKILLTGVSGFIGSKLFVVLADKYGRENIIPYTSKEIPGGLLYNATDFSVQNLEDVPIDDIEMILHAGAFTPKNGDEANCPVSCNSNVTFTDNLLKLPFSQLKKIIYLSTLDVYEVSDVIVESTPVNPASLYGVSKYYCERMIEEYSKSNNIDYQILRIGHVYGPGEEKYKKMLPLTIRNVVNGHPVEIWGDGHELRSFIYIDDVVQAIVKSFELAVNAGPINIVGGHAISISDLVDRVLEISGEKVEVIRRFSDQPAKDFVFDNSKMKKLLKLSESPLNAGLKKEIDYIRRMTVI